VFSLFVFFYQQATSTIPAKQVRSLPAGLLFAGCLLRKLAQVGIRSTTLFITRRCVGETAVKIISSLLNCSTYIPFLILKYAA
jgi:hypothetical protein